MEMTVERKKRRHDSADEIVDELLEEIVLGLSVKSLVRFSCVSKLWSFTILFDSRFIKKYNGRGREKILTSSNRLQITDACSGYLSSSIIEYTNIPIPFEKPLSYLAQCHGLFCVQIDDQLVLWNPCTTTYKKLLPLPSPPRASQFLYGLGYDALGDDYKLLLIPKQKERRLDNKKMIHLYSLKTNSWRNIPPFHESMQLKNQRCAFVNGALHWVNYGTCITIVSFNLSTEKYVELVQPKYCPDPSRRSSYVEVSVLKEKLCLIQDYNQVKTVLWLMEKDNGWIKMFEIDCKKTCVPYHSSCDWFQIRPIYLFDNGNVLLQVYAAQICTFVKGHYCVGVYIYAKEQGTLHELIDHHGIKINVAYAYVETLMLL